MISLICSTCAILQDFFISPKVNKRFMPVLNLRLRGQIKKSKRGSTLQYSKMLQLRRHQPILPSVCPHSSLTSCGLNDAFPTHLSTIVRRTKWKKHISLWSQFYSALGGNAWRLPGLQ
jgi:hypothetical protein